MNTNRQIFRNFRTTMRAVLRCVLGWNFNNCAPSLFRFVAQDIKELEPRSVSHGFIETSKPVLGFHIFNTDYPILSKQLVDSFIVEIPSLVSNSVVGFSNKNTSLKPTLRTFDFAVKGLLAGFKNILSPLEVSGILYN